MKNYDSSVPTMQAVIYHKPWHMTVEETVRPAIAPDEVLIQLEAVGICGSDVHGFTGQSGRRPNDMIMGHEACGLIVAAGKRVDSARIGERVALFNIISDEPPEPSEGDASFVRRKIVGVNLYRRGAMAEYLAVPDHAAIAIPSSVDAELAVLVEPVAVVLHGLRRLTTSSRAPRTMAIIGTGTIGLAAVMVARARGIEKVAVLDLVAEKAERSRQFGGIPVLIQKTDGPAETAARVSQALGGAPDVVLDAAGTAASFLAAVSMVANGGCVLLIGNLAKTVELPLQDAVTRELTLTGSYGFDRNAFAEALAMLPSIGKPLAAFIEQRCRLHEVPAVMTAMAKGESRPLKAIIDLR
jgi:L-iditol 2-dehydrogenase